MIFLKILAFIVLSFLAGIFYRAGGSGIYPRWIREVGVAACLIFGLLIMGLFNWWALLITGTVWLESTYFKKQGTDSTFINWLLVGFSFGLVLLPWAFGDRFHHWIGFLIRTQVCTLLTAGWSVLIGNDVIEENGRGVIQIISLPLLLIG